MMFYEASASDRAISRILQQATAAPEAVLLIDADGRVELASSSAPDVLGLPGDLLIGSQLTAWLPPADRVAFESWLTGETSRNSPQNSPLSVHQWRTVRVMDSGRAVRALEVSVSDVRGREEGRVLMFRRRADDAWFEAEAPEPAASPGTDPRSTVLSRRETEMVHLLAAGFDVQAAAAELGISVHTARTYVKSLMRKLHVRTQLQAVVAAARHGYVELS